MKHPISLLSAVVLGLAALAIFGTREPEAPQKPVAAQVQADLIDINRASAAELMVLKGIGKARAEGIIKSRPYARKDELVQKKIIPESVYDEIKDQIIARQK
jgi:DNA uptake protein ComE-like DNA-binding protein